jgi:hypothetical protein
MVPRQGVVFNSRLINDQIVGKSTWDDVLKHYQGECLIAGNGCVRETRIVKSKIHTLGINCSHSIADHKPPCQKHTST